jgi:hypothetical protein
MDHAHPRTTPSGLLIAAVVSATATASWIGFPDSDWNIIPSGIAGAFVGGLVIQSGAGAAWVLGASVVVVAGLLVEKDPSGLGPWQIVVPIQLAAAALPMVAAAHAGVFARKWLSKS